MEQTQTNDFLEKESLGKLMKKYAIPCVISLLVAALYNIVDQIFIANASYLGSYGNAANTVVFPLTVVALSIAMMIGVLLLVLVLELKKIKMLIEVLAVLLLQLLLQVLF